MNLKGKWGKGILEEDGEDFGGEVGEGILEGKWGGWRGRKEGVLEEKFRVLEKEDIWSEKGF